LHAGANDHHHGAVIAAHHHHAADAGHHHHGPVAAPRESMPGAEPTTWLLDNSTVRDHLHWQQPFQPTIGALPVAPARGEVALEIPFPRPSAPATRRALTSRARGPPRTTAA
jgi:hypothetical protein